MQENDAAAAALADAPGGVRVSGSGAARPSAAVAGPAGADKKGKHSPQDVGSESSQTRKTGAGRRDGGVGASKLSGMGLSYYLPREAGAEGLFARTGGVAVGVQASRGAGRRSRCPSCMHTRLNQMQVLVQERSGHSRMWCVLCWVRVGETMLHAHATNGVTFQRWHS